MRTERASSLPRPRRSVAITVAGGALAVLAGVAALIIVLPTSDAATRTERAVRAAIDRHTRALADGDPVAVCASITRASRETFAAIGGKTCGAAVANALRDFDGIWDDPGSVDPLTIRGTVARGTQRWASDSTTLPITVRREHGRWLVDVREPKQR